jgi:hypothetical protein
MVTKSRYVDGEGWEDYETEEEEGAPEELRREIEWVEAKICSSFSCPFSSLFTLYTVLIRLGSPPAAKERQEARQAKLDAEMTARREAQVEKLNEHARKKGEAVECQCCFDEVAAVNTGAFLPLLPSSCSPFCPTERPFPSSQADAFFSTYCSGLRRRSPLLQNLLRPQRLRRAREASTSSFLSFPSLLSPTHHLLRFVPDPTLHGRLHRPLLPVFVEGLPPAKDDRGAGEVGAGCRGREGVRGDRRVRDVSVRLLLHFPPPSSVVAGSRRCSGDGADSAPLSTIILSMQVLPLRLPHGQPRRAPPALRTSGLPQGQL